MWAGTGTVIALIMEKVMFAGRVMVIAVAQRRRIMTRQEVAGFEGFRGSFNCAVAR